jgi:hypothetical protein
MRLFGLKWEILGLERKQEGQGSWMVTFQHKTMFTAPAVNVACRTKDDLSEDVIKLVENWLLHLGDEGFTRAVNDMYVIEQD